MIPHDTTPDAHKRQLEILRGLSYEKKLQMTFELSDMLRERLKIGVRLRHPEYGQRTVELAAIRLAIGDELFRKAYPGIEVKP